MDDEYVYFNYSHGKNMISMVFEVRKSVTH